MSFSILHSQNVHNCKHYVGSIGGNRHELSLLNKGTFTLKWTGTTISNIFDGEYVLRGDTIVLYVNESLNGLFVNDSILYYKKRESLYIVNKYGIPNFRDSIKLIRPKGIEVIPL
jgi:hypothetical protein